MEKLKKDMKAKFRKDGESEADELRRTVRAVGSGVRACARSGSQRSCCFCDVDFMLSAAGSPELPEPRIRSRHGRASE